MEAFAAAMQQHTERQALCRALFLLTERRARPSPEAANAVLTALKQLCAGVRKPAADVCDLLRDHGKDWDGCSAWLEAAHDLTNLLLRIERLPLMGITHIISAHDKTPASEQVTCAGNGIDESGMNENGINGNGMNTNDITHLDAALGIDCEPDKGHTPQDSDVEASPVQALPVAAHMASPTHTSTAALANEDSIVGRHARRLFTPHRSALSEHAGALAEPAAAGDAVDAGASTTIHDSGLPIAEASQVELQRADPITSTQLTIPTAPVPSAVDVPDTPTMQLPAIAVPIPAEASNEVRAE